MLEQAKRWARSIKADVVALFLAARDPRTPLTAKLTSGAVVAYALSPIDLIPDIVPIIGYIDDLVFVPLGIMLAVRLIPVPLMLEFRALASDHGGLRNNFYGATAVVCIWMIAAIALGHWAWHRF